jgi:hypothetical protein
LIAVKIRGSRVVFTAHSHSEAEFDSVREVLHSSDVRFLEERGKRDRLGRMTVYFSFDRGYLSSVSRFLGYRFRSILGLTAVSRMPKAAEGRSYRCEELTLRGVGSKCVAIRARTKAEAIVKCAIEAGRRRWLGGLTSEGECPGD